MNARNVRFGHRRTATATAVCNERLVNGSRVDALDVVHAVESGSHVSHLHRLVVELRVVRVSVALLLSHAIRCEIDKNGRLD